MLQRVFDLISNEHVFAVSLTIYGVATIGALALAYWLTHRQWLGWALTTLDALLVLHFAASLVFFEGWSTTDAITAPGVLMVFLVLARSEEHTSELQSLMRISYAVFCLKKKNTLKQQKRT